MSENQVTQDKTSSKKEFPKELVLIDFDNNVFQFYNISVNSVGYNKFQLICHYGKLGNAGKKTMVESNNIKEIYSLARQKYHECKAKNYEEKKYILERLKPKKEKSLPSPKSEAKKQSATPSKPESNKPTSKPTAKAKFTKKYVCDLCSNNIDKKNYDTINKWARGAGNWDSNESFIGYKKVICVSCQETHGIYKKRVGQHNEKENEA